MSTRVLVLVALVGAPAALAAGYLQGISTPPPPVSTLRPPLAPMVDKPGWGAQEAAAYLARLNTPPPPPPPPVIAGPPPIDVAVLFRREYGGVINAGGPQPQVILGRSRMLKLGDIYRDGWKLSSINASTVTLAKGTETRRIGVFSPPAPTENAQNTGTSAPVVPLSLSNGLREGQLTGTQLNNIESAASRLGLTPAQRLQFRAQLTQGGVNQQSIITLVQGIRPPPSSAAITAFLNALAQAGVIPQQQAAQLAQTLPQMLSQAAGRGPGATPPVNINRGSVNNGAPIAPGGNRGGPGGGGNRGGPGGQNFGAPGGQNFGGGGGGGRGRGG